MTFRRPRLPLTREGRLWLFFSAAMLGTGFFRGINLITLLACFLLSLLLWNCWLAWRQLRCLRARRIDGEIFFAQTAQPIALEVHNAHVRSSQGVFFLQKAAHAESGLAPSGPH